MKIIFCIFIILVLPSCKNSTNIGVANKLEITDSTAIGKISINKYGTIKKSNPFKINGLECFWEQTDTLVEENTMDIIRLKDYKTKRVLINYIDCCCCKYGFDFYSSENFIDVNFDGFKDFLIRSYGSMAMFELTNIYLFDNKTKSFVYSDLSDNGIETDSINRKLTTSSFDRDFEKTKIHYFDKFGKAKYTQVITKYLDSTYEVKYRTIEKIVNGKVVEKDSTEIKE